jgi:HEAT repeat protein
VPLIFISHSHLDLDFVKDLKRQIKSAPHLIPWTDEDIIPGNSWSPAIDTAIEIAAVVVVVVSLASLRSSWVTYEWSYAMGLDRGRKQMMTLLLEVPDPALVKEGKHPPFHDKLKELQYIDFSSAQPWERLLEHLQAKAQVGNIPPAVKKAVEDLDSTDDAIVRGGINRLRTLKHIASAIEALATATRHPTPLVRIEAGFALADVSEFKDVRALAGLEAAIESGDMPTVQRAMERMQYMKTPKAIPYFEKVLLDSSYNDRSSKLISVRSLAALGSPNLIPVLRTVLSGDDGVVAVEAAKAIAAFGEASEIIHIASAVKRWIAGDTASIQTRQNLVRTLAQFGDASLPSLEDLLLEDDGSIQIAAAEALGTIASDGAMKALETGLQTEKVARRIPDYLTQALQDARKKRASK